ncbi:MAG: hypothetical protein V4712_02765 [Pseudomonadota bacterium]
MRTEEREEGGNRVTRVLIEQIDAALAEKHAKGDSAFGGVMGRSYGMNRTGR